MLHNFSPWCYCSIYNQRLTSSNKLFSLLRQRRRKGFYHRSILGHAYHNDVCLSVFCLAFYRQHRQWIDTSLGWDHACHTSMNVDQCCPQDDLKNWESGNCHYCMDQMLKCNERSKREDILTENVWKKLNWQRELKQRMNSFCSQTGFSWMTFISIPPWGRFCFFFKSIFRKRMRKFIWVKFSFNKWKRFY